MSEPVRTRGKGPAMTPPGTRLSGRVTALSDDTVTMTDGNGRPWIVPRDGALRDAHVGEEYEIQIVVQRPSKN